MKTDANKVIAQHAQTATQKALALKLHPTKIRASPRMTAYLACLLGETWTEPSILQLCVTSDGMLLARHEGHMGFDHHEGHVDDLRRNLRGMAEVAGLTSDETTALIALVPKPGAPA